MKRSSLWYLPGSSQKLIFFCIGLNGYSIFPFAIEDWYSWSTNPYSLGCQRWLTIIFLFLELIMGSLLSQQEFLIRFLVMLLRSSLIFLKFYWYSSSFLTNAFTRILEVIPSSYKRFPLPSSFQLLTECITFYSLPNWDFRIVGFKENIFSITSKKL